MRSQPGHSDGQRPPRVIAVSSGGGHWAELRRLRPAWEGADVTYVVADAAYARSAERDPPMATGQTTRVLSLPDANKTQKLRLAWLALCALWVVLRVRPDVVISTGAAPGYFVIRFAKMMGARTIWIDSIANAEEMSLSGQLARSHSDMWLTQWPHLAREEGPSYLGSVL